MEKLIEDDDFFSCTPAPNKSTGSFTYKPHSPQKEELPTHVISHNKIHKEKDKNGRTVINGKYTMLEVLGKGTFAKVRLAKVYDDKKFDVTLDQYFAVKIYYKLALT